MPLISPLMPVPLWIMDMGVKFHIHGNPLAILVTS